MSLGLLVDRFGAFIRDSHNGAGVNRSAGVEIPHEPDFPDELSHLREAVSHHLIPLLLLARADGDFAEQERDVIVAHCTTVATRKGLEMGGNHTIVLTEYVATFRPSLMQLDPALKMLSRSPHEEMGQLVTAAHAVVEADGIVRPEEKQFLIELGEDLAKLST